MHISPDRAFFGRRKGKALRGVQEERLERILPSLGIILPAEGERLDPHTLFAHRPDKFVLEIGFGGGEHLGHEAERHPDIGFLGVEPFLNGMAKMLAAIESKSLANIRLFGEDATRLMQALPDGCLDRIDLLYPDPWPKWRQRKRRFVSPHSLREMIRLLKPGGTFCFASDIDDYIGWTLAYAMSHPEWDWTAVCKADWLTPFPDWPGTRYEAKAIREGRRSSYLTFRKKMCSGV
jgi:tRNA (guanine-N7-)-methyltransferase